MMALPYASPPLPPSVPPPLVTGLIHDNEHVLPLMAGQGLARRHYQAALINFKRVFHLVCRNVTYPVTDAFFY